MTTSENQTAEGVDIVKAMKDLEDAGAAIVGLNCALGPSTMLPILKKIEDVCKVVVFS